MVEPTVCKCCGASHPQGVARFRIVIPSFDLSVPQVWPDGGAPESPTASDVVEAMRDEGTPMDVVEGWTLIQRIEVLGLHDASRDVFDG